jgi:hypothetical protein
MFYYLNLIKKKAVKSWGLEIAELKEEDMPMV